MKRSIFSEIAVAITIALFCFEAIGANPQRMELNSSINVGEFQYRGDFFEKVIVTTVLEQPYMMLKLHSPYLAGNDRFEGYLADILMKLASSTGFQYEIRLARDGRHGELNSKLLLWDGMIGEVIAGEADVAAGAIIVTDEKREYVDFTEAFLTLRSSALIRKPKSKRRPQRIETVDQLLATDLSYGVVERSAASRILSSSNEERNRHMWGRMQESKSSPIVGSVQEGIDKARRENYAFVLDSSMAEFVATRKPCDLYATEPFLDVMRYAFAMRKEDSRLRNAIDNELKRMLMSDEMQTMYLRWWRDECNESTAKEEATQELKRNTPDGKSSNSVAADGRSNANACCLSLIPLTVSALYVTIIV